MQIKRFSRLCQVNNNIYLFNISLNYDFGLQDGGGTSHAKPSYKSFEEPNSPPKFDP